MIRKMMAILGVLLLAIPAVAGTWAPNSFIYKPSTGARGEVEKKTFDSSLDRVDARLGKEIWIGDPGRGTTLPSAVTAIGGNQAVLRIPAGTWSIDANLTIPANVTLKPERGAVLALATTKTLTISGSLEAGPYQIFSCTGTGKVVFSGPTAKVYPEWWGAKADDSTDCSATIQAAVDSLPIPAVNPAGIVYFGPGKYKRTVKTTLRTGITIEGSGSYGTQIKDYTDGQDGFYALNKQGITIRNIGLYDAIYTTTRATGHALNFDGTGGWAGFNLDNVYIVGYQDGLHATLVGYPTITALRAVLQKRDSVSVTGAGSTGAVFNAPVTSSPGRYSFYFTNCVDFTLNSSIGDGSGSDGYHFEDCTSVTLNASSAEEQAGNGYYLLRCTNFTFNNPRVTKSPTTNGFYFEAATSHITINSPLITTISGYGFYLNTTVAEPYNIIVNNPFVSGDGYSGAARDIHGALRQNYGTYSVLGASWRNPYTYYTSTGNGAGVETTLATVTVPAGTLYPYVSYKVLKIVAYGTTAANANAKTIKLYWNDTVEIGQITGALNNKSWRIEGTIIISGVNTQQISTFMTTNDSTVFPASTTYTAGTAGTGSASIIKVTGNGAGASDVIMKGFTVSLGK